MPRPKEFSPEQALDKAVEVFWRRGYEATSIEDLVAAMNINRGSLYDTFGDKQRLFLACMDRYCHHMLTERFSLLDRSGSALDAIRRFFHGLLDQALADRTRRGCLVTNTATELSPHEKLIGKKVFEALAGIEQAYYQTLVRAKQQGELNKQQDPRALARFLTGMMQGVIVMYKAGTPADTIRDIVETGLSVLDGRG